MTLDEFLAFMDSGATLEGESEIHQMMHALAEEAIRICNDLNTCDRKPETIQALFSALTGREVDASVRFFSAVLFATAAKISSSAKASSSTAA